MLSLLLPLSAAASSWGGLSDTAGTLSAGEVVVRVPTGTSAVGLTDTTEIQVTPYELWIGGTRIGIEQTLLQTDRLALSLAPSLAEKWTLRRTAAELSVLVSLTGDRSRLTAALSGRLRLLRQATLGESTTHTLSFDRAHVPAALTYDHLFADSLIRTRLTVAVLDEGAPLTHGVLSTGYIRRFGRVHVDLGVGVLLGTPSEHTFLGTYTHRLLAAYPRADFWIQL